MSNITLFKALDGLPYPGIVCGFCQTPMALGAIAIVPQQVPVANICIPCLDSIASLMELDIPPLQPLVEKHNDCNQSNRRV